MGRHFKRLLMLAVTVAGLSLVYNWRDTESRTKDESRLEVAGTPDGVVDNKNSKPICERLPCACDPTQDCGSVDYNNKPGWPRPEAMAVEDVLLAQSSCGIELTELAQSMIAVDKAATARPFTDDRAVLATLWRETFACNTDFVGENCFAARWQMCQRAYEEYGPDGIRLKGLIKAIVKK